ncbi:MAG TPA: HAMP domain-containing sensor histidine kinase [Gemmatimonadales bacterium]|nr:HAMP domain-containing sensor histidine kinase [Gemmatimonadales bacterium]
MRASREWGGRRRWRPGTSGLWLLAAALAVATVVSSVSIIHGSYQHRSVARLVSRSSADQVAARAAARLEVLAAKLFASERGAAVTAEGDSLPVAARFRFEVAGARLELSAAGDSMLPSPAVLARLAGPAAGAPLRLILAPELGRHALLTASAGSAQVAGALLPAGPLLAELFRQPAPPADSDSLVAAEPLGPGSLAVAAGGDTVLGGLAPERRVRLTVRPGGPLEGLALTVALGPGQIPPALRFLGSRTQLWQNGVLLLATLVVLLLAVGSSRRELQLARARSDFVAGVSHELRMPLAQVLLAGETLMLRRERDESDRLRLADSIVREAQRLIALVDNVLLFSRAGAVPEQPRLEPVAVDALLREVAGAVRLSAEDAGQTVEPQPANGLAVQGHARLLRQALLNLVDNALKYGAPGQHILLSAVPGSPGRVRLQVQDQGPGVPAGQRSRMFEPYERLERDQASERTGSGLGLAVVRQIAGACRGTVWLEDAPGGGTRAVLELGAAGPA